MLKLDMSKAYDKVDQNFLMAILQAFGFDTQVCKLISQLVSSPSLSILVNDPPSNIFFPSRGMRQGDPLSPILFIILAKCLGRFILRKSQDQSLQGPKPSLGPSTFTHQKFMDDTILGGDTSIHKARMFKGLLNTYTMGFSQAINQEKSSVYFINTPMERQRKISCILGSNIGSLLANYLGFPLGTKPSNAFWNNIIDRFNKKLAGWKGATLSQAG